MEQYASRERAGHLELEVLKAFIPQSVEPLFGAIEMKIPCLQSHIASRSSVHYATVPRSTLAQREEERAGRPPQNSLMGADVRAPWTLSSEREN